MGRCPLCNGIGVIHQPEGICTYCCIRAANARIKAARKPRRASAAKTA